MKELITKAADELFVKYGLRSVTMDDIAKKLAISKKTIYQFFEDKDALVETIVQQKLVEQTTAMNEIFNQSSNPIDEVLRLSDYIKESMSKLHPSILYDMEKFFPKSYAMFQNHKQCCFKDSFIINLKRGIELGLYRSNINTDILAVMRLSQIEMGFNPHLFPPDKHKLQDIQVEFIMHFLYGISTIKGHKLINKYHQITEE